jgi:integrase/recombinase XerD
LGHLALRPLDPQCPLRQNGHNAARSDVQAMRYAMSGTGWYVVDFFADDAYASHWRPKTRYQALTAYGRWLAFLARREPDALQREPGTRASPALLAAYIDALSQRVTAMSVVAEINHLRHALRAVAPALDQAWIAQLQQRWTKQARPREKRSKMIDARRIYAVGVMLMREATSEPDSLKAARDYRDGFLIALLITRPLRRMNLTQLEFGKHVMPEGDGRALVLDHGTTKSGEPLEFRIRDDLVGYLLQYIKVYRPRFPGAGQHSELWPSSKDGRLGAEAIYDLVCRRTRAAFGWEISPHLFRSIAVTTIARDAPDKIGVAGDLLGHANLDTTDRYYKQSRTIDASRHHSRLITALRRAS